MPASIDECETSHDRELVLTARSYAYRVFWRLFADRPDAAVVEAVRGESFLDSLKIVIGDGGSCKEIGAVTDYLRDLDSDVAVERLRVEYERQFFSPGKHAAYPWESMNVDGDGILFQQCTLDVRREYARYGLVSKKLHSEPEDHIALEADFLLQLSLRMLESPATAILMDSKRFIEEHAAAWLPRYLEQAAKGTEAPFYFELVRLYRVFLSADVELLGELIGEIG